MSKRTFGKRASTLSLWGIAAFCAGCGDGAFGAQPGADMEQQSAAAHGNGAPGGAPGSPIEGLTIGQLQAFNTGLSLFGHVEGVADGLGPAFNERACGNCHSIGAIGGSGQQFEVRAGRVTGGNFDSLTNEGGQLFQLFGIGAAVPGCTFTGEVVPADANVVALRRTTALFGLGLVDATPDATFEAIAARQPAAIRGHTNSVFNISARANTVGKFGWKAAVPTLFQFSGDAYLNEMGITNPQFPNENLPQGSAATLAACDTVPELEDDGTDVQGFTDFMQGLGPVARAGTTGRIRAGEAMFSKFGCDGCHVAAITSGASSIAALSNKVYSPYSDFLLHDMGSLGDGIGQTGTAGLREMRTAPLWGFRVLDSNHLLHDGRAHTPTEAVLAHDGQGRAARDAFGAAPAAQQENLLLFLNSL